MIMDGYIEGLTVGEGSTSNYRNEFYSTHTKNTNKLYRKDYPLFEDSPTGKIAHIPSIYNGHCRFPNIGFQKGFIFVLFVLFSCNFAVAAGHLDVQTEEKPNEAVLVIVTLDGTIHSLDMHSGEVKGTCYTGDPLIASSGAFASGVGPHAKGVLTSLSGRMFAMGSSGRLNALPVTVPQIVQQSQPLCTQSMHSSQVIPFSPTPPNNPMK